MLKEVYFFCFYFLISFFVTIILSLKYASYFLLAFSNFLEEGLILHDSTVWVWALWQTSFFVCFWLSLPYFFVLFFLWLKNWNSQLEILLVRIYLNLVVYIVGLSIYFFIFDLFNSAFVLPNIKNLCFEFQPEIENYLNFFFGFFFDLVKSLLYFQLFLVFGLTFKSIFLNLNIYLWFLQVMGLVLFVYWFAGDGGFSDFYLCVLIFILNQCLIYSFLFFKFLRKYKK